MLHTVCIFQMSSTQARSHQLAFLEAGDGVAFSSSYRELQACIYTSLYWRVWRSHPQWSSSRSDLYQYGPYWKPHASSMSARGQSGELAAITNLPDNSTFFQELKCHMMPGKGYRDGHSSIWGRPMQTPLLLQHHMSTDSTTCIIEQHSVASIYMYLRGRVAKLDGTWVVQIQVPIILWNPPVFTPFRMSEKSKSSC